MQFGFGFKFCLAEGVELKKESGDKKDFSLINVFQKIYDVVVKGETPGQQALPPPPPPPDMAAAEAARKQQQSTEDAANAEKRQRGRASTLLTGASGAQGQATVSRTLLGG